MSEISGFFIKQKTGRNDYYRGYPVTEVMEFTIKTDSDLDDFNLLEWVPEGGGFACLRVGDEVAGMLTSGKVVKIGRVGWHTKYPNGNTGEEVE